MQKNNHLENSYPSLGEVLLYKTTDGATRVEVQFHNETLWMSLVQMAELFQKDKSTISKHIKKIFDEEELVKDSVVANYATTASDGKTYQVTYYNLDVIISVGYRVKSIRGTQFRIWANSVLKEYLIKGFAMNDDLLKEAGGGRYFKELLERIRDIRASEKVFYRQILDIYATSIDYDPHSDLSRQFFAVVQNKMHWAVHKHTAAELIFLRADSDKPFMGMSAFKGDHPNTSDIMSAKNYLTEDELKILNTMVTAYLDFAELQALRKKPMYMIDWIKKLDDFISLNDGDILNNAGHITAEKARQKAKDEFEKYKRNAIEDLSAVEKDFLAHLKNTQKALEQNNKK
jgi:hypothetical protein